jgi:hypothetical protein
MSALGQKQTFPLQNAMSALPPKADMCGAKGMSALGQKQTFVLCKSHLRAAPALQCKKVIAPTMQGLHTGGTKGLYYAVNLLRSWPFVRYLRFGGIPRMSDRPCRVLLVYPKFVPNSFWNYTDTCKLLDARYPAAPLGLITVAALLPQNWQFKLVNRNTENLSLDDIAWADMVMTGGMLNQQPDCQRIIKLCHAHGKPVVVGGPDVTSSPHLYQEADFQVLGEAEDVIKDFVASWERGERSGIFTAEKFQVDVALRSTQLQPLPLHLCAIFARLPLHLRVLRHHRALWAQAPHQVEHADACGARAAI